MTLPLPTRRTFLALPLMMVWPRVTCPSPAITTLPPLRTVRIVVPYQVSGEEWLIAAMRYRIGRAFRQAHYSLPYKGEGPGGGGSGAQIGGPSPGTPPEPGRHPPPFRRRD